jgi:ribulose-phosphate 3-epimerase
MTGIQDVKLAPSALAAGFARLGEQMAEAESAGADRIHVDLTDRHFVPNLSIGRPLGHAGAPLDAPEVRQALRG